MDWVHTLFTYTINKYNYIGRTAINSVVLETHLIPTLPYDCQVMIHCPSWQARPGGCPWETELPALAGSLGHVTFDQWNVVGSGGATVSRTFKSQDVVLQFSLPSACEKLLLY